MQLASPRVRLEEEKFCLIHVDQQSLTPGGYDGDPLTPMGRTRKLAGDWRPYEFLEASHLPCGSTLVRDREVLRSGLAVYRLMVLLDYLTYFLWA